MCVKVMSQGLSCVYVSHVTGADLCVCEVMSQKDLMIPTGKKWRDESTSTSLCGNRGLSITCAHVRVRVRVHA